MDHIDTMALHEPREADHGQRVELAEGAPGDRLDTARFRIVDKRPSRRAEHFHVRAKLGKAAIELGDEDLGAADS